MPHKCNVIKNNDLSELQKLAYKPAYKKFQKTSPVAVQELPDDLAKIAAAWATLPDNLKAAILMMVKEK